MRTKKIMLGMLLLLSYQCNLSPSVISPPIYEPPNKSLGIGSSTLYEANYFYNANYYFLGAKNENKTDGAFARAYISTDNSTTPATRSVGIKKLAPQKAFVNHKADSRKEDEKINNPLYNASINQVVLSGRYPVIAVKTKNPADTTAPTGDNQTICQVTDSNDGEVLFCNIVKLKDANSADTSGIIGIEASSRQIFAAVAPNGGTFGAAGSGITALVGKGTLLAPADATTGEEGNKAVDLLPLVGTNIVMNNHVAMHWDDRLKCLFVGLHVEHNNGGTAVAHGLLVGRITGSAEPKITLEPFIPAAAMDPPDSHNYITGFSSNTLTTEVKIHNIKTMATSTNKVYVIVNGNVYDSGVTTTTEVFAIPAVNKVYEDQAPDNGDIGKAAVKSDVNQNSVVSTDSEITKQSDASAKVGGGVAPGDVTFMHVMGDTVYICCAHASTGGKQGIFASTAIFGADGLIEAWTPWQRVMGAVDKVYGMGIDVANANIWYLTETTNPGDRVKVNQWDIEDTTLLGNLINELREEFNFDNGGVHQLFNFDRYTGSFLASDFSMMVATGYEKVALIRTGKLDGSGGFIPTSGTDFSTNLATNFKVHTDQALQDIGPICAADVSRELTIATDDNWLFVGGYNGLAVLSQSDGDGWDELSSLGDLSTYTFKKIGNFKRVHKIVCDDEYLYVLTPRALYRIELDPDKFKDTSPIALSAQVIARPENLPTCNRFDTFLDFIISSKVGILATSSGLYRIANGGNIKTSSAWTEVKSASGYSLGPVTHLFPQSIIIGIFERGGNLCVVAGNESNELATVLRFNVADTSMSAIDDDTIQPITEHTANTTDTTRDYFYPFGEFRSSFVTDGTFGIHSLSKHFGSISAILGNSKPARIIRMIASVPLIRNKEMALPLGLNENANNSGIPVLNTASGAWIIPGNWSIKVHE